MSGKRLAREYAVASRRGRCPSASRGTAMLASWYSSEHRPACRAGAPPRGSWPHTFQREEEIRR